jgi:hypothetical protein
MSKKQIIGYFHICQKGDWRKSFDITFNEIKNSGLYEVTSIIRIGIVNDLGSVINDERLNNPKFQIIFCKPSHEYERPTLLHMRVHADVDDQNTCYWYVHSKGITHFGKPNESCIIDWINFLIYWNITKWKIAYSMLEKYDIYGCNAIDKHMYCGNFWWTNSEHLTKLPVWIDSYYTAPEDWICKNTNKMFNIYSCRLIGEGHYKENIHRHEYEIPEDFNIHAYHKSNPKLHKLNYEHLISHFLQWGKYEGLNYKLPKGFDFDYYRRNKNLHHWNEGDIIWHWYKYGQYEGIKYCD